MKLRRLTTNGVARWRTLLDEVHTADFDERRRALTVDSTVTEELDGMVSFDETTLASRFAIAVHLDQVVRKAGVMDPERDSGLWSWLALAAFEQLCSRGKDRLWKTNKWYRWVFQPLDYKVYYRHLLAGPYVILRANSDDPARAAAVLCGAVGNPGEAVEQIASTQAFVASRGVMSAATRLYYDDGTKALKRGAGGKGPGAPRRFVAFLNQLDLTWDLFTLTGEEILDMLPSEFGRFRD